MKLKVNWSRFFLFFALFQTVVLMAGCSAAWLSAVSALLPALETAVSAAISFVLALEGKTVPASVTAAIQSIGNDIATEITQVQTLITQYQAAASQGLLAQIQAVFQGITTNLANILSGFQVTDAATVGKFTALVGLAVAAAQSIVALLPLVSAAMAANSPKAVLEAQDKEAAKQIDNSHKALQQAYTIIRDTPTENADVNSALMAMPSSLP